MTNEKVYQMPLNKVYELLVNKAERKGRTRSEVDEIITWLTGYSREELCRLNESGVAYGAFFEGAPRLHPNRLMVRGSVCGVKVEEIEEPLMREIRILDKLIDELSKGRPMEKILRK